MSAIGDYYTYSALAAAVYVRMGADPLTGERFAEVAQEQQRIPLSIAQYLFDPPEDSGAIPWQIAYYYGRDVPAVDDDSGFAATLFKRGNENVLAIRGVELGTPFTQESDIFHDLLGAGVGGIGMIGVAVTQVVDLVNLIQRLYAPAGATVKQIKADLSFSLPDDQTPFVSLTADIPAPLGRTVTVPMYLSFSSFDKEGAGIGALVPGEKITLTGHSLGGHLAVVAAKLFPSLVSQDVYVFNSAGLDPVSASAVTVASSASRYLRYLVESVEALAKAAQADALGAEALLLSDRAARQSGAVIAALQMLLGITASDEDPTIHSIEGEDSAPGNDISLVSSIFSGTQGLGQEILVGTEVNSHSIEQLMDALAVQNVLHTLNGSLSLDYLKGLLDAAHIDPGKSEEVLIEALHVLLVSNSPLAGEGLQLLVSDASEGLDLWTKKGRIEAREDLHRTILELHNRIEQFDAGTLELTPIIFDPSGMPTAAEVDAFAQVLREQATVAAESYAYRYSLKHLFPFILTGVDYAAVHNASGQLQLYDASNRTGAITEKWLEDRSQYLAVQLALYPQDKDVISYPEDIQLADLATQSYLHTSTFSDENGLPVLPPLPRKVVFGSSLPDVIRGSSREDHLYGDRGSDWVVGESADDYLEGGEGLDIYEYGGRRDFIEELGYLDSNDGADTIFDTDGRGVLRHVVEDSHTVSKSIGVIADASVRLSDTQWQSADGRFLYEVGAGHLRVLVNDPPGGSIVLKNFRNGDFGIHLSGDRGLREYEATARIVVGDLAPVDFGADKPGVQTQPDDLGNPIVDGPEPDRSDVLKGSDGADLIVPLGGNDFVEALAGDDQVLGGDGADVVYGGSGFDRLRGDGGRDWLYGQAGNDLIEGGADDATGGDIIDGGEGNDDLFGNVQISLQEAIRPAGASASASGVKGDWLNGGSGDDRLVGSNGNDVLMGGAGADLMVGGLGDDVLDGDNSYTASSLDWYTASVSNPFDLFFGHINNHNIVPLSGSPDVLYGGAGNDNLYGGFGNDVLYGESGDDVMAGADGDDLLIGGDGRDVMTGDSNALVFNDAGEVGQGDDYLEGGAGNDWIQGEGGDDVLLAGAGDDELFGDAVYLNSTAHGNDYLAGDEGDDKLYGQGGDDVLWGGAGMDLLVGGPGKDTYIFHKGDGVETIVDTGDGEAVPPAERSVLILGEGIRRENLKFKLGSLVIELEDGDAIHFEGFDPDDPLSTAVVGEIRFDGGGAMTFDDILAQGFEIEGSEFDDDGLSHPALGGTAVRDRIRGFSGADLLGGGAGDDLLDGGAGNDTLMGGTGDDAVFGGDGDDALWGEPGNDELDGGAGVDLLRGESGADILRGGNGNDTLWGDHFSTPLLEQGRDILFGDAGDDILVGFGGDDYLSGGEGNDLLDGGEGRDALRGGRGADTLNGGSGADTYFFAFGDGADFIDDYSNSREDADVLSLGEEIFEQDVRVRREAGDLLVSVGKADDVVRIRAYFSLLLSSGIARIDFVDGASWNRETIFDRMTTGTDGNDWLTGSDGDESLQGFLGDDYLDGYDGDDTLGGGAGIDTYLIGWTSGVDTVVDDPSELSRLQLAPGVRFDDLGAVRQGADLYLSVLDTSTKAILPDYYIHGGTFVVRDDSGEERDLAKVLGEIASRSAIATVAQAEQIFLDSTRRRFQLGLSPSGGRGEVTLRQRSVDADLIERESSRLVEIGSTYRLPVEKVLAGARDSFFALMHSGVMIADAGAGDDFIYAYGSGTEGLGSFLYGNAGNDTIVGTFDDDVLHDGSGTNYLAGNDGDDTYLLLESDSGTSVLDEALPLVMLPGGRISFGGAPFSRDTLVFGAGITLADLELDWDVLDVDEIAPGNDHDFLYSTLNIGYGAQALARVVLPSHNNRSRGAGSWGIEQVSFEDGNVSTFDELLTLASPEPIAPENQDNTYRGTDLSDVIYAYAGNDRVYGDSGADSLYGGAGFDLIDGGAGDDLLYDSSAPNGGRYSGNNVFLGGDGDDLVNPNETNDQSLYPANLIAGGRGHDSIQIEWLQLNRWILSFNRGDGLDTLLNPYGHFYYEGTISLGGGISAADVSATIVNGDLLIGTGGGEGIVLQRWAAPIIPYDHNAEHLKLQIAGPESVRTYDLTAYALNGGSLSAYLLSTSSFMAIGGAVAHRYAMAGDLDGLDFESILEVLAEPVFGISVQRISSVFAGSDEDDELSGSDLSDKLFGRGGDDRLMALGGEDLLHGDQGQDLLYGGDGDDQLFGDEGNDALLGGAGSDRLDGGASEDFLDGGDGDDIYLFGTGSGHDLLNDSPSEAGSSLGDRVILVGHLPDDIQVTHTVFEGVGGVLSQISIYVSIAASEDRLQMTLPYTGVGPFTIEYFEFADGAVWGFQELLANATVPAGTDLGDVIGGTGAGDVIHALGGNDEIFANDGNDWVDAGEGDDYVSASRGNDMLAGGDGADVIEDWFGTNVLSGGEGDDYLYVDDSTAFIAGGTGDDWLDVFGNDCIVAFNRGDGNDTLVVGGPLTISLGGVADSDLTLVLVRGAFGDDIVLDIGRGDAVTLFRLADGPLPELRLQLIEPTRVRAYDLRPAIQELLVFDAGDTNLTSIDLGSRVANWRILDSANEAYGGDLAYQYGLFGDFDRLSIDEVQLILADRKFGHEPQTFTPMNRAPSLAHEITDQYALEDSVFLFAIREDAFLDQDPGDSLTFAARLINEEPLPAWLKFHGGTRTFDGIPANEDVGSLVIEVTATDPSGASVSTEFSVIVGNVNDVPIVAKALIDIVLDEDVVFGYAVPDSTFFDLDAGDQLSLALRMGDGAELPGWLTFDPLTATFSGTPGNADVGSVLIEIIATDKEFAWVTDQFLLTVRNVNDPPVAIPDVIAMHEGGFSGNLVPQLLLNDVDPDVGDALSIVAVDANATEGSLWFDAEAQTLNYFADAVSHDQLGAGTIGVDRFAYTIMDSSGALASIEVNVTLVGVNDAPEIREALQNQLGQDGVALLFAVPDPTFADVDRGDTLTYVATLADGSALPTWLSFDPSSRTFSGTPTPADIGAIDIAITATDRGGLSARANFAVIVNPWPDQSLIGSGNADVLIGKSGDDTLDGLGGADVLIGAYGDDVYFVGNVDDAVIEFGDQGRDLVMSSVSYVLPPAVEQLVLTGTGKINGYGNELDNVLIGNSGNNTLVGGAGSDFLDGGLGKDTLVGATGDDTYVSNDPGDKIEEHPNEGTDTVRTDLSYVLGDNLENLILLGDRAIDGSGNSAHNLLIGNNAYNVLLGEAGSDILQGLGGDDQIRGGPGNGVLDGGMGDDLLSGHKGRELFIGGGGNDRLNPFSGADVIAFNRGDGSDVLNADGGSDDTLSLGGGIRYTDLHLRRVAGDLLLSTGGNEGITLADWYSSPMNRSLLTLQLIVEAMDDFDASSNDPLLNTRIQTFDFTELAVAFDAAGQVNGWAVTNALLDAHLAGSDTEAIGGDLAYQYGLNNTLSRIGLSAAQEIINAPQFGTSPQQLHPLEQLQQGQIRLV